jgi:hypothetical protein
MKFFDKLKKSFEKKKSVEVNPESPRPKKKSEKDLATERGESWVTVIKMDVNPENLHEGAFELDWNDKFVANLVRAGYQKKPDDTDADIVDRWFQNVCRNVVMETWEQFEAMNPERDRLIKSRNLGDGRSEIS